MKRLLILLICTFSISSSAHSVYYRTIDNLDITVTDEYKVEVYKEGKHMFSFDCSKHLMCRIHTTTSEDPQYKASDGRVTSSDDLKNQLFSENWENSNLLMMSSGNFDGLDFDSIANKIV